MIRKKLFVAFTILILSYSETTAQKLNTEPVVKGDYKILKLDVLSLMGLVFRRCMYHMKPHH